MKTRDFYYEIKDSKLSNKYNSITHIYNFGDDITYIISNKEINDKHFKKIAKRHFDIELDKKVGMIEDRAIPPLPNKDDLLLDILQGQREQEQIQLAIMQAQRESEIKEVK